MKGVIYYDKTGNILSITWGGEPDPEAGVPFLEVEVPTGAVVSEVDLSSEPPKLKFREYPGSDYFALEDKVTAAERGLKKTDLRVETYAKKIADSEDTITTLELAIASLYEAGL